MAGCGSRSAASQHSPGLRPTRVGGPSLSCVGSFQRVPFVSPPGASAPLGTVPQYQPLPPQGIEPGTYPLNGALNAIAGAGASDVWAVGQYAKSGGPSQTLTEHWDGSSWSIVPAPDVSGLTTQGVGDVLDGVSVLSATDAWAVGYTDLNPSPSTSSTLTMHWDGSAWKIIPAPDLSPSDGLVAVSALSPNDIWAVGSLSVGLTFGAYYAPLIEHWNGSAWSAGTIPSAGFDPLTPTAAATAGALTSSGQPPNLLGVALTGVDAISPTNVWAVGYFTPDSASPAILDQPFTAHWNGSTWTPVAAPDQYVAQLHREASDYLSAVSGTAGTGLWAVGAAAPQGTVALHSSGISWQQSVSSPRAGLYGAFNAVGVVDQTDVWAVGSSISRWDGKSWVTTYTIDGRTVDPLEAVAAISAGDVWMVGATGFIHYSCPKSR